MEILSEFNSTQFEDLIGTEQDWNYSYEDHKWVSRIVIESPNPSIQNGTVPAKENKDNKTTLQLKEFGYHWQLSIVYGKTIFILYLI